MFDNGHQIYLSGDAKFFDNLLGGGLDPTSEDAFNMYNYETKQTRSDVGPTLVLDLSFAEKLNESIQNHYCPLFQQETTFLMGITAFAD